MSSFRRWAQRISVVVLVIGVLTWWFWPRANNNQQQPAAAANPAPAQQPAPQPAPVPAPQPAPQPAAPAPAQQPVPRPATPVSDQELIALLSDNDASLAMDAALRLVGRPSAIESLVTAYQSQNQNLKTRSLWVIKRLGEPARLYMMDIIANPNNFHPKTVRAAKELIGSIENAVQPAPRPVAPAPAAPAQQPAPVVPPAAQPPAQPAAPAAQQPTPQPAAQPSVPKDTEDRIRIQEQLRAKKRELSRLQARYQLQSRMSARYRNSMLAAEISELQDHVKELEAIAARLAK